MTGTGLAETMTALLEPVAPRHGLELVAVEIAGAPKRPVIRVFLDRAGGIDLDAITSANRWISDAIDDSGSIAGSYTLEVSSPGLDRPLRTLADFERFTGSEASVRTGEPVHGRSRFTGRIIGVEGDEVILEADDELVRLAHSLIAKARLKADVDFGQGRG